MPQKLFGIDHFDNSQTEVGANINAYMAGSDSFMGENSQLPISLTFTNVLQNDVNVILNARNDARYFLKAIGIYNSANNCQFEFYLNDYLFFKTSLFGGSIVTQPFSGRIDLLLPLNSTMYLKMIGTATQALYVNIHGSWIPV